jgi:hypothetical protein
MGIQKYVKYVSNAYEQHGTMNHVILKLLLVDISEVQM